MQSTTSPSASPPDFDFNLPCRYFKSSFARSLSMYNGGGGAGGAANDMQCKSLDFDVGQYRKISVFNGNNNNSITSSNNNVTSECNSLECPPLPQRRQVAAGKNEANNSNNKNNNSSNNNNIYLESDASSDEPAEQAEDAKPPAIPARCPIVVAKSKSAGALNMQHRQQQQQQEQQQMLAQFRHAAIAENANASGNAATAAAATAAIHGNFNRPINHNTLPPLPQRPQQQQQLNGQASSPNDNGNNNEDALGNTARAGRSRCNLSNNRRNVWPTDRVDLQQQQPQQHHYQTQQQQQQQQQQQDDNLMFAVEAEDDVNIMHDDDGNATIAIAQPPVAATRSTLTAHYAASAKPPVAARTTPACIEQRLPAFKAHSDNSANVQVVLLQNQVDTLQWQLKQVETSNEMYRAVIEEIARFLDRYQTQKQQQRQLQQQQQISRSKSLYQVYDGNSNCEGHEQSTSGVGVFGDKSIGTSSCLRTRSTSNLIVDLKQSAIHNGNAAKSGGATNMKHSSLATAAADKRSYDAINTTTNNNSYSTFKDFTWRRSPKKYAESKAQAAADDLEEKLNQEAFRLSRTIQNLLNTSTRQPDLTQHRNAATACNNTLHTKVAKTPTTPTIPTIVTTTLITPAQNNASNKVNATVAADKHHSRNVPAANNSLANATAEMLFLRANNIRDSRLSLRSSTDSSVHSTTSNSSVVSTSSSSAASTSSGKVETDEDVTLHHPFHPISLPFKQHQHPLSSATEDESGFSSISSFQDIGVPLCSTMISNGTSTPNRLSLASVKLDTASLCNGNGAATTAPGLCDVVETREFACDSRNSTLKSNHPGNVLGVPLQATHDMQHRWDTTTTKTSYRNANKYQRFSTLSNEEAAAVLWV